MKDKNFPNNNSSKNLNELTDKANSIIEALEKEKNLENSVEHYKKLIKLSDLIQKEFSKTSKKITKNTKEKIKEILNKRNDKKTK